jgi:hypothetical protein
MNSQEVTMTGIDPGIWKCVCTQRCSHVTVRETAKKEQISCVLIRPLIQSVHTLSGMLNYLTPTK